MANVIKTVFTYQLNGSQTDFNIPFEYLARKFVQVTLIGVNRRELVLTTDYRFATRTTISTTRAWGPADGYQQLEIRRYTSATERLVDFADGSILRAYDLNVAQVQTLHVAEEARDLTADTIGVNNDGHLDARGRRIVNVANAVDPQDAVPLLQLQNMNNGAYQSMLSAQQAASQATQRAAAALQSEQNSYVHATNSGSYANQSANSATASATSATNSAGSAVQANNHQAAAYEWANRAENSQYTYGGRTGYSAFHWSEKSRKSQVAADAAEAGAADMYSQATIQANRAKTEADRAQSANPDNQLKKANNLLDVASIDGTRKNIHVNRLRQDPNETRVMAPSGSDSPYMGAYLTVSDSGSWGCYNNLGGGPAGNEGWKPLGIGMGGTGAPDVAGAKRNLGFTRAVELGAMFKSTAEQAGIMGLHYDISGSTSNTDIMFMWYPNGLKIKGILRSAGNNIGSGRPLIRIYSGALSESFRRLGLDGQYNSMFMPYSICLGDGPASGVVHTYIEQSAAGSGNYMDVVNHQGNYNLGWLMVDIDIYFV